MGENYAYMDVGRKKIGSETYYFDKNGYKLIPDIVGDDENVEDDIYPTQIGSDYYYLNEDEKIKPSNLKMGTKDIKIESAVLQDNQICIKGKNFTRKSTVFIDGKEKSTMYVDKNTLRVYCGEDNTKDIKNIVVKQIGLHNIPLSTTNTVKLSE